MSNEDKSVKIDIGGSISDASTKLAGNIGVGFLVFAIVLSLIAPILAHFIDIDLRSDYNNNPAKYDYKEPDILAKMLLVRIVLWIICIISWCILIWCNTSSNKWGQ